MHIVKFVINRFFAYSTNVNFSGEIVNYKRKYIFGKLRHWAHVEITLNQEKVGVAMICCRVARTKLYYRYLHYIVVIDHNSSQ